MVFCGKPSKGCADCRKRRIKCDRLIPACSQCLRAGKSCVGYRDQLDLRFRDESEKVLRKAQGIKKDKPSPPGNALIFFGGNVETVVAPSPSSSVSSVAKSPASCQQRAASISPFRTFTTEDVGIQFFFTNYVTIISVSTAGDVNCRASALHTRVFESELFREAVSSVGYAGLANVTGDLKCGVLARTKYARSVKSIAAALADPSNAEVETTFQLVLLLAVFEVVNGARGGFGVNTWGVHLDGATALLKMIDTRRKRPGKTKHRMRIQFMFSLLTKCLNNGERCPPEMIEWADECRRTHMLDVDGHSAFLVDATRLAEVIANFVNFFADIKSGIVTDPGRIYQSAMSLDLQLAVWNSQLPENWHFSEVKNDEESPYVFEGYVHKYKDAWTNRVLNNYRWARIYLNELMLEQMDIIGHGDDWNFRRARCESIENQLSRDVCRSVWSQFKSYTAEEARNMKVPPMSGAFLYLYPLAVAGSTRGISDNLHNWTLNLLGIIGGTKGIAQSLMMIPVVKERRRKALLNDSPEGSALSREVVVIM